MQMSDKSDKCLCEANSKVGVKPVKITAQQNIELWAACENGYAFGCNHTLVSKGEEVVFPQHFVPAYDQTEVHVHVRERGSEPHHVTSNPWKQMALPVCKCDNTS